MLTRKMLREIKGNFGQFFSIFLLAFLAVSMFTIFKSSDTGAFQALDNFHQETNLADGWLYGEKFNQDSLEKVRQIPEVKEAQLRMQVTASTVKQDQAQMELFLEDENQIIKPLVLEGDEFDPTDNERIWLSEKFAKAWKLSIGDSFAVAYNGVTINKKIGGLIATPEFEYMCADTDLETNYKTIGYAYMSYGGFPVREYVEHMIETGKITVKDVIKHSDVLDETIKKLQENGLTVDDITQDMMLKRVQAMSDEKLMKMMPYTQMLLTTNEPDVLSLESKISDALDGDYAVFVDKESVPGIKVFEDELNQHEQFAIVFAVVFLLVALLVIMTTMNRMVANQRTQIGTLNALGMKNGMIVRHYMAFSFFVSALGAALGLIIGPLWWGQALTDLFAQMYVLPGWKVGYAGSFYVVAAIVVLCCTFASFFSCRKLLKVKPSESLRPAPPKKGKKCIFERLPFWNRLGFNAQYNLRDISRAKLRAFMCIFGTACGMMIIACGLACNTTVDNIYDWSFSKLQNYEYDVQFSKDITLDEADSLAKQYNGELAMSEGIEIAAKKNALSKDKSTTSLVVTEGKGLYGITDVKQNVVSIPKDSVALSSKLAKKLGVEAGDSIYWHIYDKNTWIKSKIGVISRNPSVSGITMLRKDYEATDNKFEPSVLYTDKDVSGIEKNNDMVTVVHNNADLLSAFQSSMEIMNVMIAVFLAFAVVLIVVVLYNSGNLSFNERIREFATLKVLGFQSSQVRKILSIQNLWLSLIGIVVGAPFARIVLQYMFDSNGDSYDYQAVISTGDYILAGVFVLTVSVLVSFMFSKRIKKLDMVEVLKGME